MSRNLRYMILLLILLFVAVNEAVIKLRSTSWERPLLVHIYAVSGDGRAASEAYVDGLTTEHFRPIEDFVNSEAKRYGLELEAIEVEYHGRLDSHPPQPPSGRSVLENIWWSLRFRAWAWHRGWTARVSGEPARVHRVNFLMQGVEIPAGDHVVVFRFRPPLLITGAGISIVSLILAVAVGRYGCRTQRRQRA